MSVMIFNIITTPICCFQRPCCFSYLTQATHPTCSASPSRSPSQDVGSLEWNQRKKNKQVTISEFLQCTKTLPLLSLIYFCGMRGMVLAKPLTHSFPSVQGGVPLIEWIWSIFASSMTCIGVTSTVSMAQVGKIWRGIVQCSQKFLVMARWFFFFLVEKMRAVCPKIRARIREIVLEIKNEVGRKEA